MQMIRDLEGELQKFKEEARLWAKEKARMEAELATSRSAVVEETRDRIEDLISVNEELRSLIHEEREAMLEEVKNLEQ